jgi:ligand-binding sensor domain-containing protein
VSSIVEDHSGNLWFGTLSGVSRYDGVSWRTFTTSDGLANNNVTSALENRSGNLWFGTVAGVSCYDGVTWLTFTVADGLANNAVRSILADRSGNLWFGTNGGGVSRYDGVSWRTFTTSDGLAGTHVLSSCRDRGGNLWFGTSGGINRYDGAHWRTFTAQDGLVSNEVTSVMEDSSGNLWFGTNYGASRYDGMAWRTYTTADGLARNTVGAILEARDGDFWFATAHGVSRYNGVSWQSYTSADGLADDYIYSVLEDRTGNLWFGTMHGASRYDGTAWRTYTTADGLAGEMVKSMLEDSMGNLWFGIYDGGVSRFDGVTWRTFTTSDGLAENYVMSICEDRSGNLWFATRKGVSRYDGASWRTYTTADGLAENSVHSIAEDHLGNLWFGTQYSGVSRYDGASWRTYTTADGLADSHVHTILEDRSGNMWFGTSSGVSRYDGTNWGTYGLADGLSNENIITIFEDSQGCLWLGSNLGVTKHEPDRVPPRTVISPEPPRLSASTTQTISFAAAFREVEGIRFSYSFDGSPWSEWSPTNFWQAAGLSDGEHVFGVRARDKIGNVDPTPAECRFEIDAHPPVPVLTSPVAGEAVRDSVVIRGTAADPRFKEYLVEVRLLSGASLDTLIESSSPVTDGALCGWNTLPLPDGQYEVRLSVSDTLGLIGTALVGAVVDNHAPWARETAPAVVKTAAGGDIYTTNEEVHLYFPPHAFDQDTEVGIATLADPDVPDTLPNGARLVLAGYDISWGGATLAKPATLTISYGGDDPEADGALAFYMLEADSTWGRLGGTVDRSAGRISAPIGEPGRYAIYTEDGMVSGPSTLSDLVVTPRVFSARGSFASEEAAISFTLGRSGPVTVKIYNRAGRLVREVASGQQMNAGANLVRWDGRDSAANLVQAGVYLVVVEALGRKEVKTLAVVR